MSYIMQVIRLPTRQHELDHTDHIDHTDQGSICPAWQIGNRLSVQGVTYFVEAGTRSAHTALEHPAALCYEQEA